MPLCNVCKKEEAATSIREFLLVQHTLCAGCLDKKKESSRAKGVKDYASRAVYKTPTVSGKKWLGTLICLVLTLYLWNGNYYETDRSVVVKDGKLVFKDDGKEVPIKEACKT